MASHRSQPRRSLVALGASLLLSACGGAAQPAPQTPAAEAPPAKAPQTEPAAAPTPGLLGVAPEGLVEPPAECSNYVAVGATECTGSASLSDLASALELDGPQRDGGLAALELCDGFPKGIIAALRVDLAPISCADALVTDAPDELVGDPLTRDLLVGLGLAGQLSRLAKEPPTLAAPFDKGSFLAFLKSELAPWIKLQMVAIERLSLAAQKLSGYAKGVVAVEAGLADMRFVDSARAVDLPKEMKGDAEVEDAYFGQLDQVLDPRKERGRQAALVGLLLLEKQGLVVDRRGDRARALLSKLYGGARIDRLDGLLLPELAPLELSSDAQKVAARLPSFYAEHLLPADSLRDPAVAQALLRRGVPNGLRALKDAADVPETLRLALARGFFSLGQRYWVAADFAAAATLVKAGKSDGDRLLGALAEVLAKGPKNAVAMMNVGPPKTGLDVQAIDTVARRPTPAGAMAAYDAAHLLEVLSPLDAKAAYFTQLAGRFRRVSARVKGETKAQASARAQAAQDTATALSQKK